ncbi:MAG: DUF4834 family protein [Peptococcaceae bacterium]|nr:DUF4834 family protein [Peptococcaceae bacterium]
MPNMIRNILWLLVSLGLIFIAFTFFWVFLLLIGIGLIARIAYLKLFKKDPFKIHTYTIRFGSTNQRPDSPYSNSNEYTTVLDADDMTKEYKIPKIK